MQTTELYQGWVINQNVVKKTEYFEQWSHENVAHLANNAIPDIISRSPSNGAEARHCLEIARYACIELALRNEIRFVELPYTVCYKGDLYRIDNAPNYFNDQEYYSQLATRRCEFFGNAHSNRVFNRNDRSKRGF